MGARRFFVAGMYDVGSRVVIGDADAHKIRDVLRLREGDAVDVIDSGGRVFHAILDTDADGLRATLAAIVEAPPAEAPLAIDVAQGIPKGQKMDFVVEKLTELGVAAIVPLESERAVVRDPSEGKVERWRRLARTAAQQSGRTAIPQVHEALSFDALLETFSSYDVVLFPWEVAAGDAPLRSVLPELINGARRVLLVVGPEGGFSHAEADRAQESGAHLVSLGSRILRTETAALVLVAILQYLSE